MGRRRILWSALLGVIAGALLAASGSAAPDARRPVVRDPGGPYFVIGCGFSHRNNDDAIVFPGEPGRSHNHTYIGNRSVDAWSTPETLRGGSTTCALPADASGYWVPTLYDGREVVAPLVGLVYYIRRTSEPVTAFPAGLKIVAGNAEAKSRQPKGIASWTCGGVGTTPRFATIPACADDTPLQLRIQFPNCWNGKDRDSPDHRRHMKYPVGGRCPVSHSVAVPTLLLVLLYPAVSQQAEVSSGRFAAHADFVNGWDQETLIAAIAELR